MRSRKTWLILEDATMKRGVLFGIFGGFGMICGYLLCYLGVKSPERQEVAEPQGHLEFIESYPRDSLGLSEREYIGLGGAILLLEEENFPKAIAAFDGFDPESEIRLKKLALEKWYRLNYEEAWSWLEANEDIFGEDEIDEVICNLLQSAYEVAPAFAFKKQKEQIERLRSFPASFDSKKWMYRIGRYSRDPLLRVPELGALSQSLGNEGSNLSLSDSWRGPSRSREWLAKGISERREDEIQIIQENLSVEYPELLAALDRELQLKKIENATDEEWQALREQFAKVEFPADDDVEAWQDFRSRSNVMFAVFRRWFGEDRDAAIAWFLYEAPGWEEESRLLALFESDLLKVETGNEGWERFDLGVVLPLLGELDARGYETRQTWNLLISEGASSGDADPFFAGSDKIGEDQKEARLSELVKTFADNAEWDGRIWYVRNWSFYQRDLAQRLNIEEKVEKEIERLNLKSLESFEKAIKEAVE